MMTVTDTAGGFVVLLVTLPVIYSQRSWGVTYDAPQICVLRGSTVDISCTYTYPLRVNYKDATVQQSFWFTKESNGIHVDLRSDQDYSGRVENLCENNNKCTLRIKDVREGDSAEYKFRFITNQRGGSFTGSPGVTLSVTDLKVQVSRLQEYTSSVSAELRCQSSCHLPDHLTYIWNKNGDKVHEGTTYSDYFYSSDRVSCAVKDHEDVLSASVFIYSQRGWDVTYDAPQICVLRGSTVDISCTYTYPPTVNYKDTTVRRSFWFTKESNGIHVDLRSDQDYSGRVENLCENNNKCTLRIKDVREGDSAEYKFRFITNQRGGSFTGSPGVTLSVTDPQLQVHVRRPVSHRSTRTELKCHSSCQLPDGLTYIWFNKGLSVDGRKKYFHLRDFTPEDSYSCAIEGHERLRSPPVYGPKVPAVSASPSAEMVEGSSVSLTCQTDANPAAGYTWYKEDGEPLQHLTAGSQFVFSSIRSSDSGYYNCTAENELGSRSARILIDVKYTPRPPAVSVSPSAEIVEGSSVRLTCQTDANPPATCIWYKEKDKWNKGPESIYSFTLIKSEDTGFYFCNCSNPYGHNSTWKYINVQYGPKVPAVSASPSAEMVEGSSVSLTCQTDANPAAGYTWYKEDEASVITTEQIFTITDVTAEHVGVYYCEVHNTIGRRNATLRLTILAGGAWSSALVGTICAALFGSVLLLVSCLLIRMKKASAESSDPGTRPDNSAQSEEQHDLHYASVRFIKNQSDPVYYNVRPARRREKMEQVEQEEEAVEYSSVSFNSSGLRTSGEETAEDPSALYSTVKKP